MYLRMRFLLFSWHDRCRIPYSVRRSTHFGLLTSKAKHKYTLSSELSRCHILALCFGEIACHSCKVWVTQLEDELGFQCLVHCSLALWANTENLSTKYLKFTQKLILSFLMAMASAVNIANQQAKSLTHLG